MIGNSAINIDPNSATGDRVQEQQYGLRILLASLSGLLLALAYLNASWFIVGWFAFVPLLFAINNTGVAASYRYGLVAGLAFYASAAHWIVDFLVAFKGYDRIEGFAVAAVFWIYCAQLPALLAVLFTWVRTWLRVSSLVLFPALLVALYAGFPMLFPVQLGESQSAFLAALQGLEWTGVYGLDFVMGLSNILLFRLLRLRREACPTLGLAAAFSIVALWLGYGFVTNSLWDKKIAQWSSRTLGIVQPNEAPTLTTPPIYPGYSRAYPPAMEMTERLVAVGAELVIWPEARYKGYFDSPRTRAAFASEIARLGVPLLFQDMQRGDSALETAEANSEANSNERLTARSDDKAAKRYNGVALLAADGSQQGHYRKIKRVAFGETLPLLGRLPGVEDWAKAYFGSFLQDIGRGDGPAVFNSAGLQIVPLICYETMFPVFSARALPEHAEGAVLVGMSNDGWFGNTRQPYQHSNASALRAVENRVPLVHVLNNGPSVAVMPNGRIVFRSDFEQAGGFIIDLPHSPTSGGSFFSRHPTWFITAVYAALGILLILALWRRLTSLRASTHASTAT